MTREQRIQEAILLVQEEWGSNVASGATSAPSPVAYGEWLAAQRLLRKPTQEERERAHMPCATCRALHEKYGRELFVGLLPVVHEPDLSPFTEEELREINP